MPTTTKPKVFQLGRVCATHKAHDSIQPACLRNAIDRHAHCDWGDVTDNDRAANNHAVSHGLRILSQYTSQDGDDFWIITEADRSSTMILFPNEY